MIGDLSFSDHFRRLKMDQGGGFTTVTTSSQPRVVRRVVKFQQPSNTQAQLVGNPRIKRGPTIKDYDRNTDGAIFKLGDAFKAGNINLDDFFKTMTNSGFKVQKVETSTSTDPDDLGLSQTLTRVTTVTTDPGSTQTSQRPGIVTSGGHDIHVQAPTGLAQPAPMIVTQQRDVTTGLPQDAFGRASGIPSQNRKAIFKVSGSDQSGATGPSGGIPQPSVAHSKQSLRPEHGNHASNEQVASRKRQRQHGSSEDLKSAGVPKFPQSIDTNIVIDFEGDDKFPIVSTSDEDIETSSYTPLCSALCKEQNRVKKKRKISKGIHGDAAKGKVGMTASEVTIPGEEDKLPAIQMMVLNYNRMLELDRAGFVETLFRAVKLNGVDVVRILCGLVARKGIKLSSAEMREPDSSATILHVALLYDHEEMVDYLINLKDESLIMATYNNEEYKNQTALHVAVANGNEQLVTNLLNSLRRPDRKKLINTVATGSYFKTNHPDGQLCLTAAVWSGSGHMLTTLAKFGANFAMCDLSGNTLMHRLVIASVQKADKMDYRYLVDAVFDAVGEWAKHCKYKTNIPTQREMEQKLKQISTFQKLLNKQNYDGQTPITLAASTQSSLLNYMMNLDKIFRIPQNKLGSISWVTYDVTDITTFANDNYNKFSVLHILAHNSGKISRSENLEESGILDAEPIKTLIENKWKVYRLVYICWCWVHLIYVSALTYFTHDAHSFSSLDEQVMNEEGIPGNQSDINVTPVNPWLGLFVIIPMIYIVLEFVDWFGCFPYSILFMRRQSLLSKIAKRMTSEWVITGNGPYRSVCFGHSVLTIVWFVLYVERSIYQDMALSIGILLGWIFVLFFTRGCRVTSRFSIMIQKMFFRDLMYFLAVYIVILTGFSFSVSTLYSYTSDSVNTLTLVLYQMMNIVTGLEEKEQFPSTRHPAFSNILLIFYAIVAVILLMNMLIAMMNTSYETVRSTQRNLWKHQQLSIMLMIERRMIWLKPLCRYSEAGIWQKEWENEFRSYLDVTL